ncbi:hypothetical protein B0H16DRAFT_1465208 [Mycena metata]|uniref:Uncharacterized protein n=1 Tax=Mycena metata TaxID=1033252 RepID=A0AAD7IBS9_9AGAR|nr:hypothetical protein B0H16DRAFT_1465208 [Mycena metata]
MKRDGDDRDRGGTRGVPTRGRLTSGMGFINFKRGTTSTSTSGADRIIKQLGNITNPTWVRIIQDIPGCTVLVGFAIAIQVGCACAQYNTNSTNNAERRGRQGRIRSIPTTTTTTTLSLRWRRRHWQQEQRPGRKSGTPPGTRVALGGLLDIGTMDYIDIFPPGFTSMGDTRRVRVGFKIQAKFTQPVQIHWQRTSKPTRPRSRNALNSSRHDGAFPHSGAGVGGSDGDKRDAQTHPDLTSKHNNTDTSENRVTVKSLKNCMYNAVIRSSAPFDAKCNPGTYSTRRTMLPAIDAHRRRCDNASRLPVRATQECPCQCASGRGCSSIRDKIGKNRIQPVKKTWHLRDNRSALRVHVRSTTRARGPRLRRDAICLANFDFDFPELHVYSLPSDAAIYRTTIMIFHSTSVEPRRSACLKFSARRRRFTIRTQSAMPSRSREVPESTRTSEPVINQSQSSFRLSLSPFPYSGIIMIAAYLSIHWQAGHDTALMRSTRADRPFRGPDCTGLQAGRQGPPSTGSSPNEIVPNVKTWRANSRGGV